MRLSRSLIRGIIGGAVLAVAATSAIQALDVGQKAPEFTLNGTDGKPVKLSQLTAKGPVVLYTFIAAYTPT